MGSPKLTRNYTSEQETKVKDTRECEFARSRPPCDNQKDDETLAPPKNLNYGIAGRTRTSHPLRGPATVPLEVRPVRRSPRGSREAKEVIPSWRGLIPRDL